MIEPTEIERELCEEICGDALPSCKAARRVAAYRAELQEQHQRELADAVEKARGVAAERERCLGLVKPLRHAVMRSWDSGEVVALSWIEDVIEEIERGVARQ